MQWFNFSCLIGDTLTQTSKLLDILIQTINKAVNQSSQSQLVTEALTACCLLAKFSVVDDIQSGTVMNCLILNRGYILIIIFFQNMICTGVLYTHPFLGQKIRIKLEFDVLLLAGKTYDLVVILTFIMII